MRRSVIISSVFLVAAGLIQFACVQDFDQFDPAATGGNGSGGDASSSSGSAGTGGGSSSSSASSSSTASSASSSSTASSSSSSTGGMPCNNSGDCPPDTDCENWFCMMGMCDSNFETAGTVANDPTNGDCKANVCDGNGMVIPGNDDSDTPPGDGNSCTNEGCNNGTPMTTNDPVGTNCNGGKCNNMAMCVECIDDGDCNTGTNPSCFQDNCISCSDNMMNGDETGIDCGGTKCMKKCGGDMCADGMECKSTFCADGVCCDNACTGTCKSCGIDATKGTCTNIALGLPDDAPVCDTTMACNGAGVCKLKDGESCNNNMECASNNCTGAPKKCAAP